MRNIPNVISLLLAVISVTIYFSDAKICTNLFPSKGSSSNHDESWAHLSHTDEHTLSHLLPRKLMNQQQGDISNWDMVYRMMKNPPSGLKLPSGFLKEISLHNVTLDPGSVHGHAQQTNLEYLLMLDVNRLVWSFRKTAGLPTPGTPYGGWESPTQELRGHFVGHYLSATAHMWASTHNATIKERMNAVVAALVECQKKMQSGYLSAFPEEFFDRFENLTPVWAPYYTIHKIMAGLLDQFELAGNSQALKMVTSMADYFFKRVQNVIIKFSIERHWSSLNDETGGMNDILYRLYLHTVDELSGFHANTHIPVVIGTQMRYEVVGDPLAKDMVTFFMDIVNASHTYATGGTSNYEFWQDPMRLADTLSTENEESCSTYNMLKISRTLFKWTKQMSYADHYERALTNGVLGIQRGDNPGIMIYMLPLGHAVSKSVSDHGWGTPFDSFWCCYGTGVESFSKLGDSIYFEEEGDTPSLYIIQYISNTLQWKSGLSINMKVVPATSYVPYLNVTLTISLPKGANPTAMLNLRIPSWVSGVPKAFYNAETLALPSPGNFLIVNRKWNAGDKIALSLPMTPRLEAIEDDRPKFATTQAVLYGPYLLAGLTEDDWVIKTGKGTISDWLKPIPPSYNSQLFTLSQGSNTAAFALTRSKSSIVMMPLPSPGTNASVHATFRVIVQGPNSTQHMQQKDLLNNFVTLEPFDLPGQVIVHQGKETGLTITPAASAGVATTFRVVPGLDGQKGTVSLESVDFGGCYVYNAGSSVNLGCRIAAAGFKQGSSFVMQSGVSQFHPISFSATGLKRNFVMQPINSLQDEYYNVYFDVQQ